MVKTVTKADVSCCRNENEGLTPFPRGLWKSERLEVPFELDLEDE